MENSKKRREISDYPCAQKGDLVTWFHPAMYVEKVGIVLSSPDSDGVIEVLWNTGATHLVYTYEVRAV